MTAVSVPGRIGCQAPPDAVRQVVAKRAEHDEPHAAFARPAQPPGDLVAARPAGVELRVLERHAAERDDEVGLLHDVPPARAVPADVVLGRDDVGQDHLGGPAL